MARALTQQQKTKRLVESGLMIALGTILSYFQFPGPWVNGGSITLLSMLPVCIIAYRYGVKWGLFTGGVHGLLQLLIGVGGLKGISLLTFAGACLIDYILAYGVLGFAGIFRNIIKNQTLSFTVGVCLAGVLRFLCHFLSGFILWGSIMNDGFGAITFSWVYNIGYMGPEIITTTAGAFIMAGAFSLTSANFARKKAISNQD